MENNPNAKLLRIFIVEYEKITLPPSEALPMADF